VERIFLREEMAEHESTCILEKVKIGVVGMAPGVGTTFVATSLALRLSEKQECSIGFLELTGKNHAEPLIYDSLGIDKRFAGREFADFYTRIKNKENVKGLFNIDERINWALLTPEEAKTDAMDLTTIEKVRLINNISAHILICDIDCRIATRSTKYNSTSAGREEMEDLLAELDIVIFVIDPMPSKMICGYELLAMIKGFEHRGAKIIWVVNKYNEGINKRELSSVLKLKYNIKLPLISNEAFYTAEYNCMIPYSTKVVREKAEDGIEKIVNLHKIYI